jgi:MFS superfamily sulfate permease-like transporter
VSVIAVKPGEYPELRLKAWTSRVLTTFLSVCLQELCKRLPGDNVDIELKLATVVLTKLSDWMLQVERTPRFMTRQQATDLQDLSWQLRGLG